jgi:hypothetical protein
MASFSAGNQLAINQGNKYKNKKQKLIQEGFTSGRSRESFTGILGENAKMNKTITNETVNTQNQVEKLNDNIAQYGTKYKDLQDKTASYINNSKLDTTLDKNYNVFINRSMGPAEIEETKQKTCVNRESISNLTLAPGFAEAYPNNFTNYTEANNACKLWAADSEQATYAVARDANWKYQCYTGQEVATKITINLKPATIYTVLEGDATSKQGGLFANGQIGVFGGSVDPQWNITNMKSPMLIKKFNNNSYSTDEKPFQQGVNQGWWGNSNPGSVNNKNPGAWGVNMFPNSIAWWIGNLPGENTPTARISYGLNDGTKSYFYYVYNAPTAIESYLYAVLPTYMDLNINGVGKRMTPVSSSWYWGCTLSVNLKAGKNVFEVVSATGLPNSGFVFYAANANANEVLFKSGDPGWGVTTKPVPDYNLIIYAAKDQANPTGIKTVNTVPTGYEKCDAIIGGGIQKSSIASSYGRNCSNITNPPLNIRYLSVLPRSGGDSWLQIAQIAVYAIIGGRAVNVAGRGTTRATNSWQGKYGGSDDARTQLVKNIPIDGTLAARNHPNIYHADSEGPHVFWQLDLGQDYAVTKIDYYNRADCCQDRANDMKILLASNNGTFYEPLILKGGGALHSFNISANRTVVPAPPALPPAPPPPPPPPPVDPRVLVMGNNGTVSCNRYCRGALGGSWNNELPGNWRGGKCSSGGINANIPCSYIGREPGRNGLPCRCVRDDSTPWAKGWGREGACTIS